MTKAIRQRIRYLNTSDGVKLAWAEAGSGISLIKAANWLTHLEYDLESPVWRHWIHFLTDNFHFVRYDERGCGMTDWNADILPFERWVEDLEQVVEASGIQKPVALLGMSQGASTCIDYAVKHPESVSKLVLYGGYARGIARRSDANAERIYKAIVELVHFGWGTDNPAFRQVFTSRFIPRGSDEQFEWFNELCRKTTSPPVAAKLLQSRAEVDVVDLLEKVRVPTLVLHARNDAVSPISEGRLIASRIPGAQFVELDSANHILLENEPAWSRFCDAILDFMNVPNPVAENNSVFASLSPREREILSLITEGLGNSEIAERLSISEKTVRNHVSNLFDKLGVWSRAQAIVFAHDHGFRH